jgi:hypothetical protein
MLRWLLPLIALTGCTVERTTGQIVPHALNPAPLHQEMERLRTSEAIALEEIAEMQRQLVAVEAEAAGLRTRIAESQRARAEMIAIERREGQERFLSHLGLASLVLGALCLGLLLLIQSKWILTGAGSLVVIGAVSLAMAQHLAVIEYAGAVVLVLVASGAFIAVAGAVRTWLKQRAATHEAVRLGEEITLAAQTAGLDLTEVKDRARDRQEKRLGPAGQLAMKRAAQHWRQWIANDKADEIEAVIEQVQP